MSYGVTALPTTVVIDPSGKEIGRIIGDIDWNTENIRVFFRNLLKPVKIVQMEKLKLSLLMALSEFTKSRVFVLTIKTFKSKRTILSKI